MRILFVTWDGPQVDYLEALFLPIFTGLRRHGIRFDVLQFGWGGVATVGAACHAAGVGYRYVPVMRGLGGAGAVATAWKGRRHVRAAVDAFRSDAIMPRSVMPALSVLAAGGRGLRPIVFDADGLAADERVDFGGASRGGPTDRMLRMVETRMTRQAAAVLVRTPCAAAILGRRAGVSPRRFHVVANGRDETLFHPGSVADRMATRDRLGIARDAPLLVYSGSFGPKYRFDRVRAFAGAAAARRPDTRLLVLTGSPDLAHTALAGGGDGVPPPSAVVMRVPPAAVGGYLAAADLGLVFLSDKPSLRAVAPIKLGEYLLCGLPVLGTRLSGFTGAAERAGVFLDPGAGSDAAVDWWTGTVLPDRDRLRDGARALGRSAFSLTRSVEDYRVAINAAGIGAAADVPAR